MASGLSRRLRLAGSGPVLVQVRETGFEKTEVFELNNLVYPNHQKPHTVGLAGCTRRIHLIG